MAPLIRRFAAPSPRAAGRRISNELPPPLPRPRRLLAAVPPLGRAQRATVVRAGDHRVLVRLLSPVETRPPQRDAQPLGDPPRLDGARELLPLLPRLLELRLDPQRHRASPRDARDPDLGARGPGAPRRA